MNIRYPIYEGVYRILTKRVHIIANVGDCTRPKENIPCPAATLKACVPLIPIK